MRAVSLKSLAHGNKKTMSSLERRILYGQRHPRVTLWSGDGHGEGKLLNRSTQLHPSNAASPLRRTASVVAHTGISKQQKDACCTARRTSFRPLG